MADGAVIGNLTIPVIKGDKGDKGNTGEIISISLVLLSPSSTAYAINNGSTTQAQIELGIPKGLSVSTTNINASGELVFTFNDNSTVNVGKVVGKGISEVTVTDDFDFVVTYTDGTSVTACNLEEEISGAINDILESYYTKTEIDNKGFITKEVNNLTNYTLKTNTGSSIELSINNSTYVMTLNLKNSAGTTISTGTIDLPLETMVVGATYDNTNKKIVLTLKNGSTIDVPVADLVSGLQSEITNANKLSADLVDDSNSINKFTSTSEKNSWNAKYDKPSGGIPSTDMSSSVQTSLGKADTAIQDVSGKEDSSNKVTSIDENSTNTQYPGAKLVYDELVERDEEINQLYNDHPDITDTGTDLTLQGTGDLKMKVDVGGNSTQVQYEGYNLLPILNTSQTIDGVTFTINEDGTILVNGTATNGIVFELRANANPSYPSGTYRLSGCPSGGSSETYSLYWSPSVSSSVRDTGNGVVQTLQEGETNSITLRIGNGTICNNLIFKPMLVSGSTATSYEPYTNGLAVPNPNQESDINNVEGDVVVKAKNRELFNGMFKLNYAIDVNRDYTRTNITDKYSYSQLNNKYYTFGGYFKAGTYTFSVNLKGFYISLNRVAIAGTNCAFVETHIRNSFTWTQNVDGYTYFSIERDTSENNYADINFNGIDFKLSIIEGNVAKPFIGHAENSVTFPLSQGQKLMLGDTLEDDGIHHKRGQYVFTGNERFNKNSSNPTNTLFYVAKSANYLAFSKYSFTNFDNVKCNYLTEKSTQLINNNNEEGFNYDNSKELIFINIKTEENTTEAIKAKLAEWYNNGTPLIFEFNLIEDDIEPYTSAQQTAYNKLKEMQSYYDLTYVSGSSDNAQPILTAHAKKSLKVINDEISNINSRLTLLEE